VLGPDVVVHQNARRGGAFTRLALMRSSWPIEAGEAVVAVTLEWPPAVDPAEEASAPMVGVRVDPALPAGRRVQMMAPPMFAANPTLRSGAYVLGGNYWPVMRARTLDPKWWQHVEIWRQGLVAGMRETWQLTVAALDVAMAAER